MQGRGAAEAGNSPEDRKKEGGEWRGEGRKVRGTSKLPNFSQRQFHKEHKHNDK